MNQAPESRSDLSLFKSLLPFLRHDRGKYLLAILLAPASAAMVVLQPWLLKHIIDNYIEPQDLAGLQQMALLFLGAVIVAFFFEVGYVLSLSYAAMNTITRVRRKVFSHTLRLAQSFHSKQPTGRLLTRATSDVEALGETLTAGAITIVLDVLQVVGILTAMFLMDARLTLTLLLVGPPLALIIELLRRRLRALYVLVRTSLSELNAYLSERLNGIKVVQLYSDEERTLAQFDERLDTYRNATIRTNIFDALMYATVDGLTSVTMALMLYYGSGGLFEGVATAGLLAAFIDYVAKLFRPIQEFSQKIAVLQRASAALGKIFSLLDVKEFVSSGDKEVGAAKGHLQLTNLSFGYDPGVNVLHGINLEIQPGEVVALVGRTGSGKSTLGLLLSRAFQGYTGSITLDGEEITDFELDSLRRTIGTVRQDVQLFPDTVEFNLSLGQPFTAEQLEHAISAAQAGEVVQKLGGLQGTIEEGGRNVSSGEAQLLSFARTLLHNPTVVILDEATASVDSLTEAKIQRATDVILEEKTTLVIAHRLSTIINADRIALLDQGRIIELGSHQELMGLGGAYADLFHQQFDHEAHD